MKYIIQEPILTTVSNRELEPEEVLPLLKLIHEKQYDIKLIYESVDFPKTLDKVRIIALKEDSIDIQAFMSKASVKYRDISFSSIREIRLIAPKDMLDKKYKINRWHNIDVAEI